MTASWLADKIEQWPPAKLVPYARNARTHSPEQVAQIAASIAEFGFTNPILAGSDGGKGDKQRPLAIPEEQFNQNWDNIFKNKPK